jgi:O-acetyl-ADP-ribose deacetylase (regulator of RNase III)
MPFKFILHNNASRQVHLIISQGSILSFHHKHGAIVNAANKGCLGGGGVDGAISKAGGNKLFQDRISLPKFRDEDGNVIRCQTGDAKITGPNSYPKIGCNYVIHAVGPAYPSYRSFEEPDRLLRSAYIQSLERAREVKLEAIAFSLLSAGVFRGLRSQKDVLEIGLKSIFEFDYGNYPELEEIHMFAFMPAELNVLLDFVGEMGLTQVI